MYLHVRNKAQTQTHPYHQRQNGKAYLTCVIFYAIGLLFSKVVMCEVAMKIKRQHIIAVCEVAMNIKRQHIIAVSNAECKLKSRPDSLMFVPVALHELLQVVDAEQAGQEDEHRTATTREPGLRTAAGRPHQTCSYEGHTKTHVHELSTTVEALQTLEHLPPCGQTL